MIWKFLEHLRWLLSWEKWELQELRDHRPPPPISEDSEYTPQWCSGSWKCIEDVWCWTSRECRHLRSESQATPSIPQKPPQLLSSPHPWCNVSERSGEIFWHIKKNTGDRNGSPTWSANSLRSSWFWGLFKLGAHHVWQGRTGHRTQGRLGRRRSPTPSWSLMPLTPGHRVKRRVLPGWVGNKKRSCKSCLVMRFWIPKISLKAHGYYLDTSSKNQEWLYSFRLARLPPQAADLQH